MGQQPTIIEQPTTAEREAAAAKFWRKTVMKLSRDVLSERIGYSVQSIQLFERGYDYRGKPLQSRAWKRYRLVCAGLHVTDFSWGNTITGAENGQSDR